jgi:hypothetical protein
MLCEKCGRHRKNGDYFYFRYGNSLGKTATSTPGTVKKNYVIVGEEKAWICRYCYFIGMVRSPFGLGTLAILASLILIIDPKKVGASNGGFGMLLVALVMMIAFLCIPLFFHAQKYGKNTWTVFGDKQAIRARRWEFSEKGYDVFFTRASR